jgi:hypothetical protein
VKTGPGMTDDRPAEAAPQDEQRAQTRLALGAMLIPIFCVIGFAVCIVGAYHKPHPNGIKVAVVEPGDEIGIGVFMFLIVCTICGYLAVTLRFTVAYLIGGLGFGTYTGSVGTILAFIGVGALYVFAIGLITRLLQVLIGPPALFVALAIFVFLNIPSLGATYTAPVLPDFWRLLNHFWIGAGTVNAQRSILYFGGQGIGIDMLRLLAWTAVIVVLLLLPVSRKHERRRSVSTKGMSSWRASTTTS